ncbi:unnamed protein product [Brachionus calyciflorus]|uniref:Uncharacterized protein n=1 Tax=Brachionus calyciflorus TaxID=104777 RepID=A0A813MRW0_9BILA|nr:unnamed protein product [Brachionus calyciflorus]
MTHRSCSSTKESLPLFISNSSNKCLSVKRNVLVTKQEKAKNEYEKLKTLKEDFDRLSLDRENTLKESFSSIKNRVDLRREKLKKKIDDYYFQILDEIENIQKEKLAIQMNQDMIENLELIPFSYQQNLDQKDKMTKIDEYLSEIYRKILNFDKLIGELKIGENYELSTPNDDLNFFGKIEFQTKERKHEEKSILIDASSSSFIQLIHLKKHDIELRYIRDLKFTFDDKLLIAEKDIIYLYKNFKCIKQYYNENIEKLCVLSNKLFAVGCKEKIVIREIESGNYIMTIETNENGPFSLNGLKILKDDKLMT